MLELEQDMIRALWAALYSLHCAAQRLVSRTVPPTPLPRPRSFLIERGDAAEGRRLRRGVIWPGNGFSSVLIDDITYYLPSVPPPAGRISGEVLSTVRAILFACGAQPRRVVRALRRIEAATAWCEARAAGRQRAAAEILRQQAKAVEALEARAALDCLAGG